MQDFTDLTLDDLESKQLLENYSGDLIWYPSETDVSIHPGWFYHEDQDQAVKSSQILFHLYLTAVGGNSLLLLNVPPNRQGLIASPDQIQLKPLGDTIRQFKSRFSPIPIMQSTWSADLLIDQQAGRLTHPIGALTSVCPVNWINLFKLKQLS